MLQENARLHIYHDLGRVPNHGSLANLNKDINVLDL